MRTALIVEDDELVRALVARVLIREGWSVLSTSDLDLAVHLGLSRDIDIIVIDVLLTHGSGYEVLDRIRASKPRTAAFVMTGYDGRVRRSHQSMPCWGNPDSTPPGILTKPFTPSQLLAMVEQTLQ